MIQVCNPLSHELSSSNLGLSPLLVSCVISDQFLALSPKRAPLVPYLLALNHKPQAIQSWLKCGQKTGEMMAQCSCKLEDNPKALQKINLYHHCSNHACPECAKIRKRRAFATFKPIIPNPDRNKLLAFLTLSPPNYSTLKKGMNDIRRLFRAFKRNTYINQRLEGGIAVIEAKTGLDGLWNVHLHIIYYGRWLDNKIRGFCMSCHQNYIKKDDSGYYCGNHKCNSRNVQYREDSRLNQELSKLTKTPIHTYINRILTKDKALNYVLKYITQSDQTESNESRKAEYIHYTYRRRMLNTFGTLFNLGRSKTKRGPKMCKICGCQICYFTEKIATFKWNLGENPPPTLTKAKAKDLYTWFT
jgi:hypothetical protein